jgi:DNA replication ATP-dependent helicase Dna2
LLAYELDPLHQVLLVSDADSAEGGIRLKYGDAGRSELFKDNILQAAEVIGLPFSLNAIDIEIDPDGSYSPRIVVIEPDYLMDVSAVAECYLESGGDARLHLPKKFQEVRTNPYLLVGKIANFFLDELIHNPEVTFETLFPRSFFLSPIEFATLTDAQVWQMMTDCRAHYANLKRVIVNEFEQLSLDRHRMFIEPAFFSPTYGIQGRLDLFQSDPDHKYIIELKSGQPFMANAYGLSSSHYAQTLLYDLMIKAVYDFKPRQTSYILYSKNIERTLRYAPPVEAIQREVIRLRNDMLLIESRLGHHDAKGQNIFEIIHPDAFPGAKGFLKGEIKTFAETWEQLDDLEKRYIRIFSRFIANEHFLAKVGTHGSDQQNGLAGLWLDTDLEKEERFAIYRNLVVKEIAQFESDEQKDAFIIFSRETASTLLVNFRVGDIAVLYPMLDSTPSVLKSQIYKCTVTALGQNEITVRLRSRQVNYDDIRAHEKWALEHDLYDRSFNTMHSALFAFAKQPGHQRALFLGRRPPDGPITESIIFPEEIGATQKHILEKMIRAREYFLLWGPPGTGKTSVILHHLVLHYLLNTSARIILLAYTNRAVDEICEAIDAVGGEVRNTYVRIGSHISTGTQYVDQLLGNRIRKMTKRQEVVDFIRSQRIIVGTISSVAGRTELFKIVQPEIAIVDEASQILEPMLAGILPNFKKWILIGDHRQLPAVVSQPTRKTRLGEDAIQEIGLTDTRDSYFERMYQLAQDHQWDWAFDSLIEQGRMHADIMAFPGRAFYDSRLRLIRPELRQDRDYTGPLETPFHPGPDPVSQALSTQRMLWFPSAPEIESQFLKTHDDEARIVVGIVKRLEQLYGTVPEIGVITPFRAQIANIRAHFQNAGIDPDAMTIDTVERYQGSAREIIILSLSIHHPVQLLHIVSLSGKGIDRKLNVAITRAKNQFILIASPHAIAENATYRDLCDACLEIAYTEQ